MPILLEFVRRQGLIQGALGEESKQLKSLSAVSGAASMSRQRPTNDQKLSAGSAARIIKPYPSDNSTQVCNIKEESVQDSDGKGAKSDLLVGCKPRWTSMAFGGEHELFHDGEVACCCNQRVCVIKVGDWDNLYLV